MYLLNAFSLQSLNPLNQVCCLNNECKTKYEHRRNSLNPLNQVCCLNTTTCKCLCAIELQKLFRNSLHFFVLSSIFLFFSKDNHSKSLYSNYLDSFASLGDFCRFFQKSESCEYVKNHKT